MQKQCLKNETISQDNNSESKWFKKMQSISAPEPNNHPKSYHLLVDIVKESMNQTLGSIFSFPKSANNHLQMQKISINNRYWL